MLSANIYGVSVRVLLVAAVVLFGTTLSGCLRSFTTLTVHRDGTATIVDTMLFSPRFLAMLGSMDDSGLQIDSSAPQPPATDLWNDSTVAASALGFGTNVHLTEWKPLSSNGMRGYVATYKAADVNTVTLNKDRTESPLELAPENSQSAEFESSYSQHTESETAGEYSHNAEESRNNAQGSSDPFGRDDEESADKQIVTFSYTYGVLKIHNHVPEFDTSQSAADTANQSPEEVLGTIDMMGSFIRGMRLNVCVAIDGTIASTTAQNVVGNRITLMAVDFDKLLDAWVENPTLFKDFDRIKGGDIEAMQHVINEYPPGSLILELQKELEVRF